MSGRHNRRHFFKQHSLEHKPCPSNNPYDGLTVEVRNEDISPSPCEQTRMLRANINCQDDIIRQTTRFKPSRLHSKQIQYEQQSFISQFYT